MKKAFHFVAKSSRANDPLLKKTTLPNGREIVIMRRDTYDKALQAARNRKQDISDDEMPEIN